MQKPDGVGRSILQRDSGCHVSLKFHPLLGTFRLWAESIISNADMQQVMILIINTVHSKETSLREPILNSSDAFDKVGTSPEKMEANQIAFP